MPSGRHRLISLIKLWFHAQVRVQPVKLRLLKDQSLAKRPIFASKRRLTGRPPKIGGPAWIRTKDQGIRFSGKFPPRADYLFTLG